MALHRFASSLLVCHIHMSQRYALTMRTNVVRNKMGKKEEEEPSTAQIDDSSHICATPKF